MLSVARLLPKGGVRAAVGLPASGLLAGTEGPAASDESAGAASGRAAAALRLAGALPPASGLPGAEELSAAGVLSAGAFSLEKALPAAGPGLVAEAFAALPESEVCLWEKVVVISAVACPVVAVASCCVSHC